MTSSEFQQEIVQLKAPMKAFALNLTRDRDDALDLVQETYMRALSNQEKFHDGTNLKAWLLTIMKNIFINNYRKASKRNTVADASDNLYLLNAGVATAGNEAEKDFVMKDLLKAIQQLDAEYKRPFIMHYHGYKYEEIADAMKLPLGTVKSRIFFARKQMKDFLDKRGFERFQ
ncbi:MAG TPA: RNA polymerase sigma factor [Chitinophagales bacterium]|nr:RNA polymerase sigma factor [Chitinophagales bacterium]HMU70604.1 RNA polymerase sigma factor [Chitinophagales bacterium]HMZ90179.1 RNA polymerase sigma factor [Chitinophagales bacterium]HNE46028.1 RNA polymerase sigma factor [Chitinophagales bacterium]HNF70354.1 RNA polymerase sigma factor [Chitinophagales bacterium]